MSFAIRYVDFKGPPKVVEHFICFQEVTDSSGEGLTEVIFQTLAILNVNIADCRVQGYDNGANIRGKKKVCSAESWMRIVERSLCHAAAIR
jgi:hypothetical protein